MQDERADLRRGVFLTAGLDPCVAIVAFDNLERHKFLVFFDRLVVEPAPDQALDGEQGVFRVGDGLTFGGLADEALTIFRKANH